MLSGKRIKEIAKIKTGSRLYYSLDIKYAFEIREHICSCIAQAIKEERDLVADFIKDTYELTDEFCDEIVMQIKEMD